MGRHHETSCLVFLQSVRLASVHAGHLRSNAGGNHMWNQNVLTRTIPVVGNTRPQIGRKMRTAVFPVKCPKRVNSLFHVIVVLCVIACASAVSYASVTATPTFSPAAGTYSSSQTVTISDSTSGATIYYTTDGSTPTTSSNIYSGQIALSSTETLNAIATATGYAASTTGSATYTIGGASAPAYVQQCNIYDSYNTSVSCTISGVGAGHA